MREVNSKSRRPQLNEFVGVHKKHKTTIATWKNGGLEDDFFHFWRDGSWCLVADCQIISDFKSFFWGWVCCLCQFDSDSVWYFVCIFFICNISSQFISIAPEPFNQPNVICDFYWFLTPEVTSGSQSALGSQHHGLRDGKRSGAQEVNSSPNVNGVSIRCRSPVATKTLFFFVYFF